jgi:hypothetical protein
MNEIFVLLVAFAFSDWNLLSEMLLVLWNPVLNYLGCWTTGLDGSQITVEMLHTVMLVIVNSLSSASYNIGLKLIILHVWLKAKGELDAKLINVVRMLDRRDSNVRVILYVSELCATLYSNSLVTVSAYRSRWWLGFWVCCSAVSYVATC